MKNKLAIDQTMARAILAQCFEDAICWLNYAEVTHNHPTRVVMEQGEGCPSCDLYHDIQTLRYMRNKYCEDK